ncbi:hypothetical protein DYB31_006759 [Aphanomyces astaci]|uniref:RRM domain-containing protein n=1 Tax=Aphanomyces astaci TaxID=112090 RepID=A0A397FCH1_APHAT|nr:hypothetical protein DYB31_006759 [Aphanomyces astaci]
MARKQKGAAIKRKAVAEVEVAPVEEIVEAAAEEAHTESDEEGPAGSGAENDVVGEGDDDLGEDDHNEDAPGSDDGENGDDNDDDVPDLRASKKDKKKQDGEKKGVLYMSRVPPFMKPDQVRRLLSEYGAIGRIYLVEEDKTARKRRLKSGGNRQVNFTEGWIEFKFKKDAKRVAKALNTTPIGGKKRSKYHDDMWNLKYLKGFQWTHLTEKVAYENRVRDQKLRLEVAQAAKENAAFLDRVDQAKKLEKMVERKHALHPETASVPEHIRRTFRQNETVDKAAHGSLDGTNDVLGKVFKKRKTQ